LFSNLFNPVDQAVSEIEELAEEVDIENIEDLQDEFEGIIPDLPSDMGDIQGTIEAVQDEFNLGDAPPDIPIIEAEPENFITSEIFVSYTTSMDFDDVLEFYLEEMPDNDWKLKKDGTVQTDNSAVLHFRKKGRNAIVTLGINPTDDSTVVVITIQPE
jgi:hypothetical protein